MRFLFIQLDFPYPLRCGYQIRCYYMMKALSLNGHSVQLLSPGNEDVLPAFEERRWKFKELKSSQEAKYFNNITWHEKKWMNYWGIKSWIPGAIYKEIEEYQPDAIVGMGVCVLPLLAMIQDRLTIWYSGDEWVLHYASHLKDGRVASRGKIIKSIITSFVYERSLTPKIDGVVLVSPLDKWAMKWFGGAKKVTSISNGVDLEKFHPVERTPKPYTLVFWGRMDFPPNIDAMLWFYENIFIELRKHYPQVHLTIVGAKPVTSILELGNQPGITVTGEVDDISQFVKASSCVIMPMRLGAGIKNKLLEACAMGLPTVASEQCMNGLQIDKSNPPWLNARSNEDWIKCIESLWFDDSQRIELGKRARCWVEANHSWVSASELFVKFIQDCAKNSNKSLAAENIFVC